MKPSSSSAGGNAAHQNVLPHISPPAALKGVNRFSVAMSCGSGSGKVTRQCVVAAQGLHLEAQMVLRFRASKIKWTVEEYECLGTSVTPVLGDLLVV